MGRPLAAADVLILGAAYREDVGDTRYSGSELIARRLTEMGAEIRVHDPYVEHWWEFESQDTYPAPGASRARFFHRQDRLKGLQVDPDLFTAMKGVEAIVLAVRHAPYLELDPAEVVKAVGRPFALIDCFCILDDDRIRRYFELGCEVKGMGRGHIQRIKEGAVGLEYRIQVGLSSPASGTEMTTRCWRTEPPRESCVRISNGFRPVWIGFHQGQSPSSLSGPTSSR
jgi:hypothetical protein